MKLEEVKKVSPVVQREKYEYIDRNGNEHTIMIAKRQNSQVFIVAKNSRGYDESLSNFLPQPWPDYIKNSYAASDHISVLLKRAMLAGSDVHQALQNATAKNWHRIEY